MSRRLPLAIKAKICTFVTLMSNKGDYPNIAFELSKLSGAVLCHSPIVDTRVNNLLKNAFTPDAPESALTDTERKFIKTLVADLAEWRNAPPRPSGPPKQFEHLVHLRIGSSEMETLNTIQARTNEGHSEIIRRVIRSAKLR